ncbi:hypothetical protein KGM_206391 [Danaus plexippus plexippus]|uniref:Uncharacterized protein n=1 Tax=Danaus plexippus plexippus TaxID=278856 RepID=A0A212EJ52_DANPL|nr:hypothetical protein KGM_206391 [Danaus plexippus plexippus]
MSVRQAWKIDEGTGICLNAHKSEGRDEHPSVSERRRAMHGADPRLCKSIGTQQVPPVFGSPTVASIGYVLTKQCE